MTEPKPSRLDLDLHVLDAASPDLQARVAADPGLSARVAELRAEDAAFLTRYPSLDALGRAARPSRPRWWAGASVLAVAAAAVLLFTVVPKSPGVRAKGDTAVRLAVTRGAGPAVPFLGEALRSGDTLVVRYTTAHPHLLVVAAEASGAVSPWLAGPDGRSVRVEPGVERTLPMGLELDDAPGPERVFVVVSAEPLVAADVAADIRRRLAGRNEAARADLDPGDLSSWGDVSSWLITKEVP